VLAIAAGTKDCATTNALKERRMASRLVLSLLVLVLVSASVATASKKKLDKTITHRVFFDVEIGGEAAGV
jgi:multidrug transporter EmrE-like cation transporter